MTAQPEDFLRTLESRPTAGLEVDLERARGIAVALEQQLARVAALAEKWRYKGEFGWGAWQEGHGPDQEGYILDQAAADLRAALEAPDA